MQRRILHVGCGHKSNRLPPQYAAYRETRLDLDPEVEPDIKASVVSMPMIAEEQFDAIFASHVLEHLYVHEVAMALSEFLRVLKPGGTADIRVPDLKAIGGRVGLDQTGDAIYHNPIYGAVTPLDLLYGHRASIANGNLFMQHKTGFTQKVMRRALAVAGFDAVEFDTMTTPFELKAVAMKKNDSIFGVGGPAEGIENAYADSDKVAAAQK